MVYTQRKQSAVPSGPVGTHGPCVLNLPFLFPQKKREAKRKLPADVRKLKNDCEVRGKRTRRARFAAAVRLAIQLQVLDRYTSAQTSFSHVRPSPSFFPPLSPIGRRTSRFSHRPRHGHLVIPHFDAESRNTRLGHSALDAESRNTGRSTCKIHSLYVPFLDPASRAG